MYWNFDGYARPLEFLLIADFLNFQLEKYDILLVLLALERRIGFILIII